MPTSKILEKCRSSIEDEQKAMKQQLERYLALSAQMAAYQNGQGPAPTAEEFQQWRTDVERVVELRKQLGVNLSGS